MGFFQYFPRAIKEVAKVSAYGTNKYQVSFSDKAFTKPEFSKESFLDATARHLLDRAIDGEVNHEDADLYHLAQVAWDSLAALEKLLIEKENKDVG